MLILCDKCNQTTDAKLDKATEVPLCSDCGEVIEKITPFAVNAMKSNREFVDKGKQSFSFPCQTCSERRQGLVAQDGNSVVCTGCGEDLGVSPFMRQTMKRLGLFVRS
jgi:hypothetical protein